jgi:hypothetical protein
VTLTVAFANVQHEQQVVKTLIDLFSPQAVDLGSFEPRWPLPLPACGRFVRECSFQGHKLLQG